MPAWEIPPQSIVLENAQIHVWQFNLVHDEGTIKKLREILSSDEMLRAEKITALKSKQEYIASHGIIRKILAIYTKTLIENLDIVTGDHGKPSINKPVSGIHFNLSHSSGLGILAVARDTELGIDIEYAHREIEVACISKRFFTPAEAEAILELPMDKHKPAFYHTWTCKEALLKATGKGLSYGLDKFQVNIHPDEPAKILATANKQDSDGWALINLPPIENYYSALAAANKPWTIQCWKWDEGN